MGIEAPAAVGIVREEVVQRIAEENIRAGATQDQRKWLEGLSSEPEDADSDPDEGGSVASEETESGSDPGDPDG